MAEATFTFKGGMNNVLDPAAVGAPDTQKRELVFTEVIDLLNVDPDDTGGIRLRGGRESFSPGAGYHSGWSNPYNPTEGYCVRNNQLWRFTVGSDAVPTFTLIRNDLLQLPMSFVQVNDVVRYSNGVQCGVIENGADTPSFAPSAPFKAPMVAGKFEEFYNGRLYALVDNYGGASGSTLLCSDPMDVPGGIESMDERFNVVAVYDGVAKGICRVNTGLFVSAGDETFYHGGGDPQIGDGFTQVSVAPYPMIPGTVLPVAAELFDVPGLGDWAAIWASPRGICVGGSNGFFKNLTLDKVSYPGGDIGCSLLRYQNGLTQYLFVSRAEGP